MPVPLKVYYCLKCFHRMPLYYRKGEVFRDDKITRCKSCGCDDALYHKNEVWIKTREDAARNATTRLEKIDIYHDAVLFNGWPYPWEMT